MSLPPEAACALGTLRLVLIVTFTLLPLEVTLYCASTGKREHSSTRLSARQSGWHRFHSSRSRARPLHARHVVDPVRHVRHRLVVQAAEVPYVRLCVTCSTDGEFSGQTVITMKLPLVQAVWATKSHLSPKGARFDSPGRLALVHIHKSKIIEFPHKNAGAVERISNTPKYPSGLFIPVC